VAVTTTRITAAVLLILISSNLAAAEEGDSQETLLCEKHESASLYTGYRFAGPDGVTTLANPYGVNRSGATGGFAAAMMGHELKLRADGQFLHPDDYQSELLLDYRGIVRLELEGRSLHHNLLRAPLPESFAVPNPPAPHWISYGSSPTPAATELGVTSRQDRADLRVRFGDFPGHLSLGYWRFDQTGHDQLVASDFDWTPPNTSASYTFSDLTRRIEQETHQGRIGLDANLGPLGLAYSFMIRDFSSSAPLISAPFIAAVPAESRVTSHTAKLFTNLSGGLTIAAAYSITQRENTSRRSDLTRSGRPRDTIQQVAGDLAYTPFRQLTVALKYRHFEQDRETPATVTTAYSGTTLVRPGTDSVRDSLTLTSTWRPDRLLTLRGEYRADLISRDNVWSPTGQTVSDESNQLHKGAISALWRPWHTTRINASYSYTTNNRPDTVYDFDRRHNGSLLADWSASGRWGVNLHYRATADRNRQTGTSHWDNNQITSQVTPRNSLIQSAGSSIWFSPLKRLMLTASYGLLAFDAEQALLLSPSAGSPQLTGDYSSLGHVYGLDVVYALNDQWDLSSSLQQVRSSARFSLPSSVPAIGSYTRLDSTESSASARIDWRFAKQFGCMLDYRFSAYRAEDRRYNGDIHSTTVALTARW
jgi:hypothetical protein